MEKRHRCKLCFRNFANGRALGGHMRSHMMKFYDEAKKKQQYDDDDDFDFQPIHSFSSISSSSSSEDEISEEVKAGLVEQSDFYAASALQDKESETESSMQTRKKIVKRRRGSKRVPKSRVSDLGDFFQVKKKSKLEEEKGKNSYDQSSLSSISDTTPEEHVAQCLIMLSRDNWRRAEVEFQDKAEEEEDDFGDCKEKKFRDSGVRKVIKSKVRGKYRCEECNKLFKSYQALGGHRASHRKVRADVAAAAPPSRGGCSKAAPAVKLHQCPFCQRVFASGQALGGHKRSHFIGPGAISGNVGNTGAVVQNSILNIDLNLPAPMDDEEISQIDLSAVSEAEIVHPIKL
ncbi:hypothetical protein CASFOL_039889 [Castilleja foliolosa]|uniref:C2H2-type domain-containing protein n=1 Tax=Castilleja foliolosa TaxID=1961234 RepID=A0ABD3BGU9_9LAMI